MFEPFTPEERAARVAMILAHPPTVSHAAIAAATGISRETVRRVRFGKLWAEVLPDLERIQPATRGLRCNRCVHWEPRGSHRGDTGACGLGIPEPLVDGVTWARGCGAYTQAG